MFKWLKIFESSRWEKVCEKFVPFKNSVTRQEKEILLILERDQFGNERAWKVDNEERENYDVDYLKAGFKKMGIKIDD